MITVNWVYIVVSHPPVITAGWVDWYGSPLLQPMPSCPRWKQSSLTVNEVAEDVVDNQLLKYYQQYMTMIPMMTHTADTPVVEEVPPVQHVWLQVGNIVAALL